MTRTRVSPCSSRLLLPSSPIRWKERIDRRRSVPSSSFSDISRNTARHSPGYVLGLLVGSALQLVLPFLTQSIVDVGIKNQDIGFIWLILLGQLMLTVSRTAIDFARRWFLLRISMRINISLVSDFFIKLLKLPMSFFDTKLMGDLMQRMNDHSRVNNFLTQQTLNITFAMLTFVVFSVVLFIYNKVVFAIFLLGSILYGGWMALFLQSKKGARL